jgi:hypothetical protein
MRCTQRDNSGQNKSRATSHSTPDPRQIASQCPVCAAVALDVSRQERVSNSRARTLFAGCRASYDTSRTARINDAWLFGRSQPLQRSPMACCDSCALHNSENRTLCMFRSSFVSALAALGGAALFTYRSWRISTTRLWEARFPRPPMGLGRGSNRLLSGSNHAFRKIKDVIWQLKERVASPKSRGKR